MWEIDKDTMTIICTAGDTPFLRVKCNIPDENGNLIEYIPEDEDIFIFAVKKTKYDKKPLFYREIPKDTMTLMLQEEDTKGLELGKYIYEVSLNKPESGYHCTFIDNKFLVITTEIY